MDAGQHFPRLEERRCDFDWEYCDETLALEGIVWINRNQQVSCPARLLREPKVDIGLDLFEAHRSSVTLNVLRIDLSQVNLLASRPTI